MVGLIAASEAPFKVCNRHRFGGTVERMVQTVIDLDQRKGERVSGGHWSYMSFPSVLQGDKAIGSTIRVLLEGRNMGAANL